MSETRTAMMQRYRGIRRSLPADTLLPIRLGDFDEMFFEDAKVASAILPVALAKRNLIPMCGVPHHAAESHIRRLLKAGRRVPVGDQVSEPQGWQIKGGVGFAFVDRTTGNFRVTELARVQPAEVLVAPPPNPGP